MKYVKAKAVFPQALLDEIQKYVQGEMVYIPKPPSTYKEWGTNTGAKDTRNQRNANIVQVFQSGATIAQLAEMFNLSEDTIKKIVYTKQ